MTCPRYALATRVGGEGRWSETLSGSLAHLHRFAQPAMDPLPGAIVAPVRK